MKDLNRIETLSRKKGNGLAELYVNNQKLLIYEQSGASVTETNVIPLPNGNYLKRHYKLESDRPRHFIEFLNRICKETDIKRY